MSASSCTALLDGDERSIDTLARTLGENVVGQRCDVRSPASVRAAVDAAAAAFGGLDALVVSAGVIHFKRLAEVTEADWDLTLDVNLKGAFLACQAVAPHLVESERGRMVLISSDAGRRGAPNIQAYASSKFGMIGLTESLAAELAPAGVTVNAVCPVACPTTGIGEQVPAWKSEARHVTAADVAAAAARGNPVGRNASEADVVAAIEFLLSDAASFLTGRQRRSRRTTRPLDRASHAAGAGQRCAARSPRGRRRSGGADHLRASAPPLIAAPAA